jgi:amidohydrolase
MDYKKLEKLRKELHANPEISGREEETASKILDFIRGMSPDEILTGIGGTGILATWDSGEEGPGILFRAELDALPIQELGDLPHKSKKKGVAHLCGHDGHSAILCGLAMDLSEARPGKGKIHLLFQPSEENGEGAAAVLADDKFIPIKPDYVFALHNIPGYPLHSLIVKNGSFTAAVNSIIIHLDGKTSHAAEPENGKNPASAMAEILIKSKKLENPNPESTNMRLITPVHAVLGEKAYGTSAGHAEIHFTIRCWDNDKLNLLEKEIESLASTIAGEHEIGCRYEYTQTFLANENDSHCMEIVRSSAGKMKLTVIERDYPFKWGEDFGLFTSKYRGSMFGLGAGNEQPAIHNPDYDFPDELIETGISVFSEIIRQILNEHV